MSLLIKVTMEGSSAENSNKPYPGCCIFFVKRKRRFCKLQPVADRQYCAQHLTAESSQKGSESTCEDASGQPARKRIPCPLDPKHTVYADMLTKHLKKCNSREKDLPEYHVKGINRIGVEDNQIIQEYHVKGINRIGVEDNQIIQVPLSSLSKEELLHLIGNVQKVYTAHSVDIPSLVLNHDILQDQLSNPMNGISARKHLCQVSSLLGQLKRVNLLGSDTCYIEFGAGRGQMSHWVQSAVRDQSNVSFILVDRAHVRHKFDTPHRLNKDGPSYERLKMDIEHLCLGKVPSVSGSSTPLVAYSKHLCGAATDLTLHCLMESLQQKTSQDPLTTTQSSPFVNGIVIALCCHHQCDWTSYVGKKWWLAQGLTAKDFMAVSHMSSWATCGTKGQMPKNSLEKQIDTNKRVSSLGETAQENTSNLTQGLPESHSIDDGKYHQNHVSSDLTHKSEKVTAAKQLQDLDARKGKIVQQEQVDSSIGKLSGQLESENSNRPKISKATREGDVHHNSAGRDISAQRLVGLDVAEREDVGRQCKRLIDIGRMAYLEGLGFRPHLIFYVDQELSLENVAMVAVSNKIDAS